MNIILVRHGQTTENQSRVVQWPDAVLSEDGEKQANLLAKRLASFNIGHIISSDMTRAAQTAAAVASHHDKNIEYCELLHERNLGNLRGKHYADIDFDFFAADYIPADGESWADFHQRVDSAWQYVLNAAQQCKGDLVVVTHGLVCHRIAAAYLNQHQHCEVPEKWDNTSVTIFRPEVPYSTTVLNCSSHLRDGSELAVATKGAAI